MARSVASHLQIPSSWEEVTNWSEGQQSDIGDGIGENSLVLPLLLPVEAVEEEEEEEEECREA